MAPRKLNLSNTALLNKATARASSLFAVDEDRAYRELTLSQVQINANQPRKYFDPAELEALAASIDRHGLLQPIVVHEVGPDRYQILAGERRYRAFALRGREIIPAIVMTSDDPKVLALVENVQRVDLHALEIAGSLRELIDDKGLTQEEAGTLIGKSQAHVARLLGLLKLPRDMLDEVVEHRQISTSLLLEIAEIGDPELQRTLWQQAKGGLTVRELRQAKQEGKNLPVVLPLPPALPSAALDGDPESDQVPAQTVVPLATPVPASDYTRTHERAHPSHDRAVKGIRKHVLAIRELHGQGTRLSARQIDDLRALKQEIDALLAE